jgi:tubulin polyglutamylase TTLL9
VLFSPLVVWLYREAFARFTFTAYSMEDLENTAVHLTNVAIQKKSVDYDQNKGCKWLYSRLKQYLTTCHGHTRVQQLASDIDNVILTSILSVQRIMIQDKRCFELYGYDILFDSQLKPWLCEVNASPSLTADTPSDYQLKFDMFNDMFDVVDVENRRTGAETRVGGFDLVWHDGPVLQPPLMGYPGCPQPLNFFLGGYNLDRHDCLQGVFQRSAAAKLSTT